MLRGLFLALWQRTNADSALFLNLFMRKGQHSLTSVNIRRKALLSSDGFRKRMTSRSPPSLKYVIHLHFDVRSSIRSISDRFLVRGFVPLFRSFLDWFQSIQTRRCHCLRLKDVLMFQASSYKLFFVCNHVTKNYYVICRRHVGG